MSTTDLERRLAVVLQRHAEDAMSKTHTDERLAELLEQTGTEDSRRRRYQLIGAVVATAAVTALVFWAATRGTDRAEPEPVAPITPVQVANEYLQALAVYDLPRAESYFSADPDLRLWDDLVADVAGWRAAQAWSQAAGFEMDPGACKKESTIAPETIRFRCPYVFEGLGSKELGLGPYNGSTYVVTVQDGAVIAATDEFAYTSNGYNVEAWEPFAAWVADNYPQDAEVMYDDNGNQVTTDESTALWHEHVFGYVTAKLAEQ